MRRLTSLTFSKCLHYDSSSSFLFLQRCFIAITWTALSKPTNWKNSTHTVESKSFNCPAAQRMNMQQPITRWPDVAVVAEFAVWPNCNHGKYPLLHNLWTEIFGQFCSWLLLHQHYYIIYWHSGLWYIFSVNNATCHHPLLTGSIWTWTSTSGNYSFATLCLPSSLLLLYFFASLKGNLLPRVWRLLNKDWLQDC